MKKIYMGVMIGAFLTTGCKKLVEVPPPVTQLVTSSVFNNNYTATAALTDIYSNMDGESLGMEVYTGWSGDELIDYSGGSGSIYHNALTAENDGSSLQFWSTFYQYIYRANAVLEGLQGQHGVSPSVSNQLSGEALLIRAFWYFYLVNMYGDVPLVLSTDYNVNRMAARVTKDKVYEQMVTDLNRADSLLSSNFVDATDTATTTERVRPNQSTAQALLARVYLYKGDYPQAEAAASAVIADSRFVLLSDLTQVFLKNSQETIWALMPTPTTYHTGEGGFLTLTAAPANATYATAFSTRMMSAFEPQDKRRAIWIDSINALGQTFYYPSKYKADFTSTTQTEYPIMLRLSEQYLIRAEARAWQNNLTGANSDVSDLNAIRNRAGLSPYSGGTDRTSLLNAISHERQVELFTEWCDRWFNLKRTGVVDSLMTIVTPEKGGQGWAPYQALYPIKITDLQTDPNLTQTPGY